MAASCKSSEASPTASSIKRESIDVVAKDGASFHGHRRIYPIQILGDKPCDNGFRKSIMLHDVKDLSPEQRRAVENLLGRPVAEDESVSIKGIRPSAIIPSRLSSEERKEALASLQRYFAKVDAQRMPVTEAEEEEIINQALRSTSPNYKPVH